ncbi:MAG TPA: hypothetical protein VJK54_06640 [Chthoniobacterales bacterium]|nr:hypothetical protein [Chthoniobacterales bacterium]
MVNAPHNHLVLEAVDAMPSAGGYSTSASAQQRLQNAVVIDENHLQINPTSAKPSFCSEATYLVFLKTLSLLQEQGKLTLTPSLLAILRPLHQEDGSGVWGRWNANGPGTARLFYELGLGPNFMDLSSAQPGDFLKVFWSDAIGSSEHGHSVVYLGTENKNDILSILYWSSNIPNGYGKKAVPRSRMHHLLFSRLTHPEAILKASSLPYRDAYLASLLHRSSSLQEMKTRVYSQVNQF